MEATECSTGLLGRRDSDGVHMQVRFPIPSQTDTCFFLFLLFVKLVNSCVLRLYCRVRTAGHLEFNMLGKKPSDVNMKDVENSIPLLII